MPPCKHKDVAFAKNAGVVDSNVFSCPAFIHSSSRTSILPYWTPLFWAAALSVPLHSLKSYLVPVLYKLLEHEFLDIFAFVSGSIVYFIFRLFLGRYVASAIKSLFQGYCHVIYLLCDGRPQNSKVSSSPTHQNITKDGSWETERSYGNHRDLDVIDDDNDYELHPSYQTLVDKEPDQYARPPNSPSYLNLLRLVIVYILLQFGTPSELRAFVNQLWTEIEIGTPRQLNWLMILVLLHVTYKCLGRIVSAIERVVYSNLTPEQQKERSILSTLPRKIRRAMQMSLNSTLATLIVFATLATVGTLSAVLSIGVAHDVQGIVAQTHYRVMAFKEGVVHPGFDDNKTGHEKGTGRTFVYEADGALSQAYDAGVHWFDPIVKGAFPDLEWGVTDWARQFANVVVDMVDQSYSTGACEAKLEQDVDLHTFFQQYTINQSPLSGNNEPKAQTVPPEPTPLEQPEFWTIPTLKSLGFTGIPSMKTNGFHSQTQPSRALNISQAKYLLSLVLGYKGFDGETMLWGFNAFNDLLFRWILFLLTLLTLTGLKVSPLQRIGWIIDQTLASSSSFGSSKLSADASPGRVLAKSTEFAITGTFLAMFKLAVYHTAFTVAWTHFLADQVTSLIAVGAAPYDFVAVKYAWLTSLFGIILTVFPIAPNWLVSVPAGVIHFYIYGQRPMEAIAMIGGHIIFATVVDGAVWDSHVIKNVRPGVSSAFWLGLWVFLGGMKWGTKGLLLGPVFFAAIPSIWAALIELRGKPRPSSKDDFLYDTTTMNGKRLQRRRM
ncbi:hypothetical protein BGZ50_008619 [Haplosporangium sp. Z 11]|nr:hypothetical protein BGZ50_008619 [Haplosporangium sp. Z 11]